MLSQIEIEDANQYAREILDKALREVSRELNDSHHWQRVHWLAWGTLLHAYDYLLDGTDFNSGCPCSEQLQR